MAADKHISKCSSILGILTTRLYLKIFGSYTLATHRVSTVAVSSVVRRVCDRLYKRDISLSYKEYGLSNT